ncbi:hypothetical protein, variant 2 [Aphanomyces invadans]|uniref:Uncharacterized protein n=1 Tax=Aphanomyces invadans TaxID=157072 RepID=A0A024TFH7_9STRA|nr:hypothetical protein, variant 2 [Aphanomyces invadans]ETV92885.1 hypothetical protein, variant 2 [Aphanomyces invadans]|eukprot:XP_008878411.1 hypothetical protein, variant 2 [Aphanomyces invadans]
MLASPLHATTAATAGGKGSHHARNSHAHQQHRRATSHMASPAAEVVVDVIQVSAISFRKVVQSSMLPQHGLRCKFHLSVGGKSVGVVGSTASTAGQTNELMWGGAADGRTVMHLNVSPSMGLSLGIQVLCGSLVVATATVPLRELERPPHRTSGWYDLNPTGRIELSFVYNATPTSGVRLSISSATSLSTHTRQLTDKCNDDDVNLNGESIVEDGMNGHSASSSSDGENDHESDNDSDVYPSHDSDGEPSPEKQDHRHHASCASPFGDPYRMKGFDVQSSQTNNAEPADTSTMVRPLPPSTLDDLDHLLDATIQANSWRPPSSKHQTRRHFHGRPHGPSTPPQPTGKRSDFEDLFRYGIASTTSAMPRHQQAPAIHPYGKGTASDKDIAVSVLPATDTTTASRNMHRRRIVDEDVVAASANPLAVPPPPHPIVLFPPQTPGAVSASHPKITTDNAVQPPTSLADQSQVLADRMFHWTQRIAQLERKAAATDQAAAQHTTSTVWTKARLGDTPTSELIRERRQSCPTASQPLHDLPLSLTRVDRSNGIHRSRHEGQVGLGRHPHVDPLSIPTSSSVRNSFVFGICSRTTIQKDSMNQRVVSLEIDRFVGPEVRPCAASTTCSTPFRSSRTKVGRTRHRRRPLPQV